MLESRFYYFSYHEWLLKIKKGCACAQPCESQPELFRAEENLHPPAGEFSLLKQQGRSIRALPAAFPGSAFCPSPPPFRLKPLSPSDPPPHEGAQQNKP
jgi:hypothetical protein